MLFASTTSLKLGGHVSSETLKLSLATVVLLMMAAAPLAAQSTQPSPPQSQQQKGEVETAVARLAQRLKNVISVRRKRAKKGRFDIKKTLRRNLEYGGVPFKLRFDRRKKEKPQVVILCDVSDSVRNVSRFMLQFVYSLQDLYSRVRSFIFVAEIGEITNLTRERVRQVEVRGLLALRGRANTSGLR